MSSAVDICNLALIRLGAKPIASLTEATEQARKCNAIYDNIRKIVLRDHPWNFATKIVTLSESADDTVTGWNYIYSYESSCLFARRVFNESTTVGETEEFLNLQSAVLNANYLIIACNISPAYLEYTADVTNTALFDNAFIDAFAWRLSAELAQALTGSVATVNDKIQRYLWSLDRAKTLNSSEGYQVPDQTSASIDARG
jgi:hypothetical protein